MISMKKLAGIFSDFGFENPHTYLNSGNIILKSSFSEDELTEKIKTGLSENLGTDINILIRNSIDLEQIANENPFPDAPGSKVGVYLVKEPIDERILSEFITSGREKIVLGRREVYIYYPDGIGRSRLKFPGILKDGTMRNINTITKLVKIINQG